MDAKSYLNNIRNIDKYITMKLEQINELRQMNITAVITDMPMNTETENDKIANIIIKIDKLQGEINKYIDTLVDYKAQALRYIKEINDMDIRIVLEMRYVNNDKWETIAETLNIEVRQVFRLNAKAIVKIQKIMDKQ